MAVDRREFLKASAASVLAAGATPSGGNPAGRAQGAPVAAAGGALTRPFAFCALADPHASEESREGYAHLGSNVEKFFACVQEMNRLQGDEKPDFLLILGDVHLWELRKHLDRVPVPVHVIAGNHDSGGAKDEMRRVFPDDFSRNGEETDYYSFVHKGVRFIGLCDAIADHVGHLCSSNIMPSGQCEWLDAELAAPEEHKILFAHIPPHPDGGDQNMYLARNDSRYLDEAIKRTQPTAALFGHLHQATSERTIGGTRLITLGACCWNGDRTPVGFMLVKVTAEGITTREISTGAYVRP